jgi:type I restriction-modification system DNA methylase subunit
VLILRPAKDKGRRGKVLFVNGEQLFRPGRNQNTLESVHAQQIRAAYEAFADADGLAHVAGLDEIARNDCDLTVSLYVAPAPVGVQRTLADALASGEW